MSYENPRLDFFNSSADMVASFCDGNPGAMTVLCKVIAEAESIDPDDAFGWMGVLGSLDNLDCYGSKIWMFYKDVANENLVTMIGLTRAVQLGIMPEDILREAIDGKTVVTQEFIVDTITQVKERLPMFGRTNA